ncbi:MAG: RDD family protein, partial [Candidatus Saccharimonas sp.]|nr:RDD family protein [Planctomycetaceae bacterium]
PWYYLGTVKDGELWHEEMQRSSNMPAPPKECRILRFGLETGVELDSGLKTPSELGVPSWIGGTLYFVTQTAIFRQEGNEFAKLATLPPEGSFHSSVFLWAGRLTMIRQDDEGGIRLVHVSDGKWIDGRPILLPETNRVWHDDPQRGRRVLLPLTSREPISKAPPSSYRFVTVLEHGQQHHVIVADYRGFAAYRTGFEFADEPHEGVSALAPENAPRDVSGWEPIGPDQANVTRSWMVMTSSREGLLFLSWGVSWGDPMMVARRRPEGTWEWFDFPIERDRNWFYRFASDPADAHAYLIGADTLWGSAEVQRIEGHTLLRPHVIIPGIEREYLARWKRLGLCLLFAWGLHAALLMGGVNWESRGVTRAKYGFGIRRVTLAPLWRRAIATMIDVVLLSVTLSLLRCLCVFSFGLEWEPASDMRLAESLLNVECLVGARGFDSIPGELVGSSIGWIFQPLGLGRDFLGIWVVAMLVLCGAKVYLEGRFGVTPGKWLLGLRTVRSTLRPCGFARALVRNVVYCFDVPFLLTPLPAAMSLMFSEHRQTLGDRAADTLVVRAAEICDAMPAQT